MKVDVAMKHIKTNGCICKHVERVLQRLHAVTEAGIEQARVIFSERTVILDTGNQQELLCSRFFEQRDC